MSASASPPRGAAPVPLLFAACVVGHLFIARVGWCGGSPGPTT